jgi:hypothetical protein
MLTVLARLTLRITKKKSSVLLSWFGGREIQAEKADS